MRGWGATTPKRTTLWSNSTAVRFFSTSKKARSIGKGKGPKLAEVYHDKSGRKRYKGIPQYWVNVKTTGAYEQEHEESLVDRTVGEGTAEAFNLGLPAEGDGAMLPEEAEPGADTDLDDPDLEDGNASAGTSKFPGKAQVERESVLEAGWHSQVKHMHGELESWFTCQCVCEAVENVGTVMTNLLRVQTRMETLRDRLAATDSPEAKAKPFCTELLNLFAIGLETVRMACTSILMDGI